MSRQADRAVPEPTRRGQACVLVYTAAFVAVTLVGFLAPPRRVRRPLQRALLWPAAWAGRRVDWAAHDWVARTRRRLGTAPPVRRACRRLLDDALTATDEPAGYVGTVAPPPAAGDAGAWVERRLAAAGFRRNPTAYLEYRRRDGRDLERSSWALRASVAADTQLHVRVFENADGTVDLYGHREPSVLAGADHYGPPDYRAGVAATLRVCRGAGVPVERRATVGGVPPAPVAGDAPEPAGRSRSATASP